ncbi:MAG TPA: tetratricopeptide repeat protein [Drouetiella sp.]
MFHQLTSGAFRILAEPSSDSRIYKLNSKAMTQLAVGSCVVIASLLAIPDGIALIPRSTDLVSWVLGVIGVWLSAAVLWFVGFLGILHCVAFLVRGVEVDESGVRLCRLARPIEWNHIDAVAMEPQLLFSKLFSLTPVARKMTIFERKKAKKAGGEPHLVPHHLPSFLFAPEEFEKLLGDITSHKFDLSPNAPDVIVAEQASFPKLKKIYGAMVWQRVGLSLLITFGLFNLLGRKAAVNYEYNSGNKAFEARNFALAERQYYKATLADPSFPAAWNNLANVEFIQGKFAAAEKHWNKAMFLKPDFVEAKVSLAYFALQKRDFDRAKFLIESALQLAPTNAAALVSRADYAMRVGHIQDGISDARAVLTDDPKRTHSNRFTAVCILAQGKLRQGHPEEAKKILDEMAPVADPLAHDGRNITYRLIVSSQVDRALGKLDDAQKAMTAALKRADESVDVKIEAANVATARKDYDRASTLLTQCEKLMPSNPWIYIARAQLVFAQTGKIDRELLEKARSCPNQDAPALGEVAELYLKDHDPTSAKFCAVQATQIESNTPSALEVLHKEVVKNARMFLQNQTTQNQTLQSQTTQNQTTQNQTTQNQTTPNQTTPNQTPQAK